MFLIIDVDGNDASKEYNSYKEAKKVLDKIRNDFIIWNTIRDGEAEETDEDSLEGDEE